MEMESLESFEVALGAVVKTEITKLREQMSWDKQARKSRHVRDP